MNMLHIIDGCNNRRLSVIMLAMQIYANNAPKGLRFRFMEVG